MTTPIVKLRAIAGEDRQGLQMEEGLVAGVTSDGRLTVIMERSSDVPVVARVLSDQLDPRKIDQGARVLVAVDGARTPIVLGVIQDRLSEPQSTSDRESVVDLSLVAKDSITLKCGESAITLRRNGEVVIRGIKIVSRAVGANKIRGATVSIN
jgi:hypothetical protein